MCCETANAFGGQPNHDLQLCFPLLHADGLDLRFYDDGSGLKTYRVSIDERVRTWCCVCDRTHRSLTVAFCLLQYSVVYTVESLSLFHPFLFAAFEAANFQIDFFGNPVMRTAQWDSVWRKTFRIFRHTLLDTWLFINTRIMALNSRI